MNREQQRKATAVKYLGILQELYNRLNNSPRLRAKDFTREMEASTNLFPVLKEAGIVSQKQPHLFTWNSIGPNLAMAHRVTEEIRNKVRTCKANKVEVERTCPPIPKDQVKLVDGGTDFNQVAEVMEEVGRITVKDLEEVSPAVDVQGKKAVEYYRTSYLWGLFTVRKVKLV